MTCPTCANELTKTKLGHICFECGYTDIANKKLPKVTKHSELVHSEHRLAIPTEPGTDTILTLTDMTTFTAESNASQGAFSWIQVSVGRFSYYAMVFVLMVVLAGVGYHYFSQRERAASDCQRNLSGTSSEPAKADIPSTSPMPCRP